MELDYSDEPKDELLRVGEPAESLIVSQVDSLYLDGARPRRRVFHAPSPPPRIARPASQAYSYVDLGGRTKEQRGQSD
jgi:hypothetical protein